MQKVFSEIKECQLGGGGDMTANFRHLILASGFKSSLSDYNLRYANSLVLANDPHLIMYQSLENEEEFKQQFSIKQGQVNYIKRNEPEFVCRCGSRDQDESSNFPKLAPAFPSF